IRMMRRIVGIASVCLLLIHLNSAANRLSVTAIPIKTSDGYVVTKTFLGKTVGERVSDIGFEQAGMVNELLVNDGQAVKKDEPLAKLDTRLLTERQVELKALVEDMRLQVELSQKDLKRLSKLAKENNVSEQAYDTQRTTVQRNLRNLVRVKSQLARINIDLENSVLKAPYDAIVLDRFANVGAYVNSGQPVMKLQQTDIDEVHIGIPQVYLPRLQQSGCYPLIIEHNTYKGCIDKILPRLSDKTQTVRVIFEMKSDKPILSGQIVKLPFDIEIKEKGAWVPTKALAQGLRGTWVVYRLVDSSGAKKIESVQVDVIYTTKNKSYVTGPLNEGDLIVAAGLQKFSPGMVVEINQAMAKIQ
ncbi:MAG: efflux RND transporter periplasmic adaptor subunit, partial [Coxiellaceae bacterium]|nr:efflux RND transporter periplasmic adaptor subunit [Coxiellaceae bacterium]